LNIRAVRSVLSSCCRLLAGSTLARGSPNPRACHGRCSACYWARGGRHRDRHAALCLRDDRATTTGSRSCAGARAFRNRRVMNTVTRAPNIDTKYTNVKPLRDMWQSKADLKQAAWPRDAARHALAPVRDHSRHGTAHRVLVCLCVAKKIIHKKRGSFGHGRDGKGVACPEASTHCLGAGDFIPTMRLGIRRTPSWRDARRLTIQGIVDGSSSSAARTCSWGWSPASGSAISCGHPQSTCDDRLVGEVDSPSRTAYLSERRCYSLHRRLQHQQRHVPGSASEDQRDRCPRIYLLQLGFNPARFCWVFVMDGFERELRRDMLISRGDLIVGWGVFLGEPDQAHSLTLSVLC